MRRRALRAPRKLNSFVFIAEKLSHYRLSFCFAFVSLYSFNFGNLSVGLLIFPSNQNRGQGRNSTPNESATGDFQTQSWVSCQSEGTCFIRQVAPPHSTFPIKSRVNLQNNHVLAPNSYRNRLFSHLNSLMVTVNLSVRCDISYLRRHGQKGEVFPLLIFGAAGSTKGKRSK